MHRTLLGAVGLLWLSTLASAQSKAPRPRPTVLTNVATQSGDDAPRQHIVLRDGRIEAFLPVEQAPPAGHWVVDGSDLIALPAFVDAYTHAGCETPTPTIEQDRPIDAGSGVRVDMRMANRKGIQPHFHAADAFAMEDGDNDGYRKQGFGLVLSAPEGELLAGRSALVTTHDAAARDRVVRPLVFDHASFRTPDDAPGYPSTLMGYHAQLRQFFLDAQRHGVLRQRFERGVPGSRPTHDRSLDVGLEILEGERWLVCEAQSHRDIRRWLRLGDELGLRIAISGGREAYRLADVLSARGVPVFMTLDWGTEVDDPDADEKGADESKEAEDAAAATEREPSWVYEEPLEVRRDRRSRWVERRDGAKALAAAGVRMAFGSGAGRPKDLLGAVRTLVEEGLPREAALAGLTQGASELLGVNASYGRLQPGAMASLALWTADPLVDDKAQVRWMVVDGFVHEYESKKSGRDADAEPPGEGLDMNGRWELSVDGNDKPQVLTLTMQEDGTVSGSVQFESPMGGGEQEEEVEGYLSGQALSLEASFQVGDFQVSWVLSCTFGEDADAFNGTASVSGPGFENTNDCAARRLPEREERQANLDAVLHGVRLEGGAPSMPFVSRRSLTPICGCNRHHDHLGHHEDHDDEEEDDQ